MLIRSAFLLALCAPAETDTPAPAIAGGGDPAAPAVETPAAAAAPAVTAKPPGMIDRAIAMFQDKGALVAETTTLKSTNATQAARIAELEGQVAALTTERDGLRAEFGRLEAALAKANEEKTTVQREVTHQLASAGVPESGLPKGGGPGVVTEASADDLWKQAEAEADPKRKGELANRAMAAAARVRDKGLN